MKKFLLICIDFLDGLIFILKIAIAVFIAIVAASKVKAQDAFGVASPIMQVVCRNPAAPAPSSAHLLHFYSLMDSLDAVPTGAINLTENNSPVYTDVGPNGDACFQGDGNAYLSATLEDLFTLGSWSVNFWAKNYSQAQTGLSSYGDAGTESGTIQFYYSIQNYVGGPAIYMGNGSPIWQDGAVDSSAWTMYTATYDGTTWACYINGQPETPIVGSNSDPGPTSASVVGIGTRIMNGVSVNADLTSLALWSTWQGAISSTEVLRQYNGGTGRRYSEQ